jgi:hypothetical protein
LKATGVSTTGFTYTGPTLHPEDRAAQRSASAIIVVSVLTSEIAVVIEGIMLCPAVMPWPACDLGRETQLPNGSGTSTP